MEITLNNYEEYLLSYVDGELDEVETAALMQFLQAHPDKKKELALLQAVVLPAEEAVAFPQKQSLYREEKSRAGKTIMLKRYLWPSVAAAACIAMLMVWVLHPGNNGNTGNHPVAINKPTQPAVHQVQPATLKPDTTTAALAVTKEPKKSEKETSAPATEKTSVENNKKEQASPSVPLPDTKQERVITANTVKPSLPALSSLDSPAEDSGIHATLVAGNISPHYDEVAVNEPVINEKPDNALPNETRIRKEEVADSKIVNATEALAVAKRDLDSTITQKLEDINEKTSGFFNHIAKNGIKIGRVTFAFNN